MSDIIDDPVVHDVVIVGAGLAGSVIAAKLAEAGIGDVVLLEAGNQAYFDWSPETGSASSFEDRRDGLLETFYANPMKEDNSPYTDLTYAPSPMLDSDTDYFVQPLSGQRFDSTYMRMVGGTTYHWLGIAIRLLPNDLRMQSAYGVGVDWPISYAELEPWYAKAEHELGVAGDESCAGEAWRSTPFQMPPIPHSYLDRRLMAAVASDRYDGPPVTVTPPPVARNSEPYGGRPACAGSNNCTPLCPIQAKYDATIHLKRALGQPDLQGRRVTKPVDLRLGALLVKVAVDTDSPKQIDHLEYLDVGTALQRRSIRARTYVLAMHAVESAKVLLGSNDRGGVANSSDQVGRNLMDHPCQLTYARTEPVHPWRGPLVTGTIDDYRDGPERRQRAAIRTEFQNTGFAWSTYSPGSTISTAISELLGAGRIGRPISERIADDLSREVTIDSLLDQLPDPSNRVTLDESRDPIGLRRPKLTYTIDPYTHAGGDFAFSLCRSILTAMGADPTTIRAGATYVGAGHLLGTHRMGTNPATSVTDASGRCHDHPNLRLVGCGSFPTIGTANPSLTLVALALRTADEMIGELTGRSQGA